MYFSSQRKQKCIDIIDTLLNYKISRIFAEPVDPILDNCPNYFEKIKRPMDLGTVRNNLINDGYQSFSEFCSDVDQIWENAYEFNGEYSIITLLAQQLKIWFHNLTFLMTDDEASDWITRLHDLQNQTCMFTIQFSSMPTKSSFEDVKIETLQEISPSPDDLPEVPQDEPAPAEHVQPIEKEPPVNPPKPKHPSTSVEKPKRPTKKSERIIHADNLIEIHKQICLLEDEKALSKILSIIKNNEPQMKVTDKSVIDLNSLSMKTRVKIYDYLQNND